MATNEGFFRDDSDTVSLGLSLNLLPNRGARGGAPARLNIIHFHCLCSIRLVIMLNFIVLEVAYSPSPFNLATRVRSLPRRPRFFGGGGGLVTQSSPNFKADEQNHDY